MGLGAASLRRRFFLAAGDQQATRESSWEEVMKSRLSSTVWLLVFWIGLALFGVLGLAYYAGAHSVAQAGADGGSVPGGANGALFGAAALALVAAISLIFVLSKRVLTPVDELAKFSER